MHPHLKKKSDLTETRDLKMDRRFHKRALSAATAVLTLTSAVTSVSAAQKNEITISTNKSVIRSGDSFNLKVGYKPDSIGVSGFTINLHYDPEAVTLNIPDESSYNISSSFALVTNFEYENDTIRIVGADMSASNVRSETNLAYLSFTVNDGYEGDIAFWTDVDTLVYSYGAGFVNADYTAHDESSKYVLTVAPEEIETETTTTAPKPQPAPETSTETTTTSTETTTASLPEQIIPESTETTASADESPVPDEDTVTTPVQTDSDQGYASPDGEADQNGGALFSHTQGSSDYVNEEALQYSFSPYDYIDDDIYDEPVDISISIYSTDTVVGGIGMQTSEGWQIYDGQVADGNAVWSANDVDLSDVQGDISVQIYYMKNNSVFEINAISVTRASEIEQVPEPDTPEYTEQPDISEEDSSIPDNDIQLDYTENVPELPADNNSDSEELPETDSPQDIPSEDEISSSLPESSYDDPSEIPEDSLSIDDSSVVNTDSSMADTNSSSNSSSSGSERVNNSNTDPSSVVAAVNNARNIADSNPGTGKKIATEFYIAGGLIIASLGQIGYSFYSLGKRNKKNK